MNKKIVPYAVCALLGASSCIALNIWFALLKIEKLALKYEATPYKEVAEGLYSGHWLVVFLRIVIISVLMEEIIFRGILYNLLKRWLHNIYVAGVLSVLLFAVLHGNLEQGLYAFLVGLLLVFVYETYRHLAAPILLHMTANLTSLALTQILGDTSPHPAISLLIAFSTTTVGVICVAWILNTKKRTT